MESESEPTKTKAGFWLPAFGTRKGIPGDLVPTTVFDNTKAIHAVDGQFQPFSVSFLQS